MNNSESPCPDTLKTHGSDQLHSGDRVCPCGTHRSPGAEDAPLCGVLNHLPLHSGRQPGFDSSH